MHQIDKDTGATSSSIAEHVLEVLLETFSFPLYLHPPLQPPLYVRIHSYTGSQFFSGSTYRSSTRKILISPQKISPVLKKPSNKSRAIISAEKDSPPFIQCLSQEKNTTAVLRNVFGEEMKRGCLIFVD